LKRADIIFQRGRQREQDGPACAHYDRVG
jgi:hypothetical protein